MKSHLTSFIVLLIGLSISLSSCVFVVDPVPGPDGPPGNAYFGVDYDYAMPYSYWDNNSSIPTNPILGQYYPSGTGVFDFEYFINRYEYWYGTYRIFRNAGGPGGTNGQPGAPGADTYLLLICNPDGFYEERGNYKMSAEMGDTIRIEQQLGNDRIEIVMTKTTTDLRPSTNEPKFLNEQF